MEYMELVTGAYNGPSPEQNTIVLLPEIQTNGLVIKTVSADSEISYVTDPAFNGVREALQNAHLIADA